MEKQKYISSLTVIGIIVGLTVSLTALAQTNPGLDGGAARGGQMQRPSVIGTVSAVSGNSLTVNSRGGFGVNSTATIYTIDASNATGDKKRRDFFCFRYHSRRYNNGSRDSQRYECCRDKYPRWSHDGGSAGWKRN